MSATLSRIIRRKSLVEFTGLRKSTINKLIELGEFPRPISLTSGGRAKGWLETDLISWQQRRREASNEMAPLAKGGVNDR